MSNANNECVDILHKLFSTINDSVLDITPITEGELLEAGSDVLKVKKIVETLENEKQYLMNELVIARTLIARLQHNNYIQNIMKERKKTRDKYTDAEKLKSGNYKRCKFCDSVLLKKNIRGDIDQNHYTTKKCMDIYFTKLMKDKKQLFTENRKDGAIILRDFIGLKNTNGSLEYKYLKFLKITQAEDMPYYKWCEMYKWVRWFKAFCNTILLTSKEDISVKQYIITH